MRISVTAGLFLLVFIAATAYGDETPAPSTLFPKGTFSLSLEADYAHSFQLSKTQFEAGAVGVGLYWFDNFACNIELGGFALQQSGPNPILTEMDFRFRHHLINLGRFSGFVDFGAGVSYATHRTPMTGTQFDFTVQPGLGATWELKQHVFLMAGARFWHLSNARLEGPGRNPSINATEGYAGVLFTF